MQKRGLINSRIKKNNWKMWKDTRKYIEYPRSISVKSSYIDQKKITGQYCNKLR